MLDYESMEVVMEIITLKSDTDSDSGISNDDHECHDIDNHNECELSENRQISGTLFRLPVHCTRGFRSLCSSLLSLIVELCTPQTELVDRFVTSTNNVRRSTRISHSPAAFITATPKRRTISG